ncbi:MarR family transcriptional regulator [Evansella sp. AB-P1]|uniref:MarR family winged helix-turn-helix transcriptional regulator n=1 Tax=Evansella sp. AB-P1 TaxID=3037653 RepID=UPI00241CCB7C|nr:MarR family transcriptional regulator [Evansella sp. AB-P1]MDG5788654.1 MarR family transcriptional regulator [Evansella sp. AB-P1]
MSYNGDMHLLVNYFRGLSKAMEDEWQKLAKGLGLTQAELHVMWIVNSKGKISVSKIAKIGLWDRSTVMQILKRLKEKNLITVTKDENDLRVTHISLTKEGKEKRNLSQFKESKFLEFLCLYQNENKRFMDELFKFQKELNSYFHGDEFIEWVEETSKNYNE